ncbi:poly(A) RNA polymerase GLD2-like [Bolinopsis microptera]|uniref:poly(A) RNA polymerase GLD2-like n=1 Tax=Bolinopsis microptera TaxID=2820187 RepID=UPI003079032E
MKRKRPYNNHAQQQRDVQHIPHNNPNGQQDRYNTPGPSIGSSSGFIPLSNGHRAPQSHPPSHDSRMKTPRRTNQPPSRSPYNNNKSNHHHKSKKQVDKPAAVINSSAPLKNSKGAPPVQVTNTTRKSIIDKKDDIDKIDIIDKKRSVEKTDSNEDKDIIVLDELSSTSPDHDKSWSKRRKVISIASDDEEKTDGVEDQASSSNQHSSGPSKDSENVLPHKYINHLTSALRKYHTNQMQDKAFLDRKLFLRDGIQRIVGQNFGEGVLHLTGSSMSGFGTMKSDADFALVFDPQLNTISKKKSRNVITRLASCLRRQAFCANVEMIFAKVPIIKFFDKISSCDVDININNIVGIKNSFLLRSISLADDRIPPLVIALKAWAKSHDINSAFMGSLSSYLLVTMMIYFLQNGVSPPMLPPLKQYVDSLQSVNVNTQLQQFVPKTFLKFEVRNKEEIGEIFVKFFRFWVKKFRQNKVFSVYTAQEKIRTYNTPYLDTSAYVLVLEEPFQKDNIARAVRPQQLGEVKDKFQQACDQFKDIARFDELFGELT